MKNFEIITEFRHCDDTVEIEKTNCKTLLSDPPEPCLSFTPEELGTHLQSAWTSESMETKAAVCLRHRCL